ncbi:peptidyl-prolyl cis-trans isomerase [Microvirga sp. HBU67558]|uniref:peptidylprolyl isomerase n=1 Tax=Microvirga TaxID=186650 RepID=UPI001B374F54|nr:MULTISPECIES: peptidylprolyl isomerase [unclassified Microvirga]MBQ0822843.1 peptidyl-prolyl cis-trans isomerase [Microvirga sp. HBU67558]
MRLLKEPLLHFLAIGGLLFAVHATFGSGREAAPTAPAVRITVAEADWLREMWARQWRRPPTNEELTRLVKDLVTEEVLAREAKALGLDVGDTVIRRRLAQKMAFLLDDTIRVAEPPEAELRALYERRPDLVLTPPRVSFTQVFFRREQGDGRARATLAALSNSSAAPEEQGDSLLLGDAFTDQDEHALTNLFGPSFARTILDLPVGHWSGPVESSYGLHLVKVTAVSPREARPFAEIRERLAEEWRRERQEAAQTQLLQGLIRKHQVAVDLAVRPYLGCLADQVEVRP